MLQAKWSILSDDEISIIHDLDNMDRSISSYEVGFVNDVLMKLNRYGEYKASFTAKQRNFILKLADKYLE